MDLLEAIVGELRAAELEGREITRIVVGRNAVRDTVVVLPDGFEARTAALHVHADDWAELDVQAPSDVVRLYGVPVAR